MQSFYASLLNLYKQSSSLNLTSSDKLMKILEGVKGQKIKAGFAGKDSEAFNAKRECILRSFVIYLNEDPDSFFKEYLESASEDAERDIAATVLGIHTVVRHGEDEPKDVGIVIEGRKVLQNINSVMMAFLMLFGLIYALDLNYPDNLKYTFEFCQKIILNLDGHKLNAKIQQLEIKLFG